MDFSKCAVVSSIHSDRIICVVFYSKHSLHVLPIMTQSCPICLLLSPSVVGLTSGACLCLSLREAPPPLATQSFMPHTGCPPKPLLSPTAVPTPALPEGMNQGQKPRNRQTGGWGHDRKLRACSTQGSGTIQIECVIASSNSSQNKGLDWSRFGSARLCGDFDKIVCSHFAHADSKSVDWLMGVKCFSVPGFCRQGEWGINISCVRSQYAQSRSVVLLVNSMMWCFWLFYFPFYGMEGKKTVGILADMVERSESGSFWHMLLPFIFI